ncbi:hypothetical protein [uncultured Clostridium sp.]|jgi:hypothetical protein|uniref:hypothetical protein n=1 Tax=uncultured Clostridium sp. TaxID=59620 RepID=UPI002606E41C|nr:hypothetical protein [uncultured Clostridium sp.]
MKIKSLVISIAAIVSVVIATEVIYHVSTAIKTKYEIEHQVQKTPEQVLNQQEENLTPKQEEIARYKSQLLFLISDYSKISNDDQNILNIMKQLLSAKVSGNVKVESAKVQEAKTQIDEYWKTNNHFSTKSGLKISTAFTSYLNTLNEYLDNGIKTGELNAGELPKFAASNMDEINNSINNVKVQLMGLGASLDLSSPTHFTIQNSGDYQEQT